MPEDEPSPVRDPCRIQRLRGTGMLLVAVAFLVQVGGGVVGFRDSMGLHHGIPPVAGGLLSVGLVVLGAVLMGLGLALLARAKARSALWGLWGLLALLTWIGWMILLFIFLRLDDRTE